MLEGAIVTAATHSNTQQHKSCSLGNVMVTELDKERDREGTKVSCDKERNDKERRVSFALRFYGNNKSRSGPDSHLPLVLPLWRWSACALFLLLSLFFCLTLWFSPFALSSLSPLSLSLCITRVLYVCGVRAEIGHLDPAPIPISFITRFHLAFSRLSPSLSQAAQDRDLWKRVCAARAILTTPNKLA